MTVNRIATLIPTENLDTMLRFYRDVLGLRIEREEEDIAFLEGGLGIVAAAEPIDRDDLSLNGVMVALFVDDARAAFNELTARGVPFVVAPTDVANTVVAAFRDPDGYVLQLMQDRPGAAKD